MSSIAMMKKKGKIYIGTSGWHYKHWKDNFYPSDIRSDEQLLFYTQLFKTVELNNSFYRMPSIDAIKLWIKGSPRDFLFAVKGNRYMTHNKKLKDCKEPLKYFITRVSSFGKKLGPILFQLPPKWNVNAERLKSFVKMLPKKHKFAFEFRNPSWYNEDIYSILRLHNCAFCIYHLMYHLSPLIITADFVYIRLHGPQEKYAGRYSIESLQRWAANIKNWLNDGKDVYVYFDNDQSGYAPLNANELSELMQF